MYACVYVCMYVFVVRCVSVYGLHVVSCVSVYVLQMECETQDMRWCWKKRGDGMCAMQLACVKTISDACVETIWDTCACVKTK